MDLGIRGKKALVCASSKGLGKGCALALAEAGVDLVLNARGAEALEQTAEEIRARFQVNVTAIAADITTQEGRAAVLAAAGHIDILVTNAGGPPPGLWSDWDRDDFIAAIDANMLTPIALIKSVLPSMIEQGWGRIVNITSQSVRAPIPQLGLSNSARAGLTGYVAGTSRQVAPHGVTINNLLPGIHATDRAISLDGKVAADTGVSIDDANSAREATIPARRYGTLEEFGATCAFMCSQHAGFMVGQNVMLDGGATNMTM
jgi:3-oxoacyl-[acyl-carrier protein] reductase